MTYTETQLQAALFSNLGDKVKSMPCHCNNCLVQMVEDGLPLRFLVKYKQQVFQNCVRPTHPKVKIGSTHLRLLFAKWPVRATALAQIGAITVK